MSEGFPPIWELISYYNMFLLTGPLFLGLSVYFWVRYIRWKCGTAGATSTRDGERKATGRWEISDHLVGTVVFLLIGGVHFWGTYGSVLNALKFRGVSSQIVEIQVERFMGDARADVNRIGEPVVIGDRGLFRDGFKRLEAAKSFHTNHEHFLDGYRIQFKLAGSQEYSDQYLSLFTRTNRRSGLHVVIPHFGRGDPGALRHGGKYSCEGFHEWFFQEIAPLLANKDTIAADNAT